MSEETDSLLELGLTPRFMWLWAEEFIRNPRAKQDMSEYDLACMTAVVREAVEAHRLVTQYAEVTIQMSEELELLRAGTLIEMDDDAASEQLEKLRLKGQRLHMRLIGTVERWRVRGKTPEMMELKGEEEDEE